MELMRTFIDFVSVQQVMCTTTSLFDGHWDRNFFLKKTTPLEALFGLSMLATSTIILWKEFPNPYLFDFHFVQILLVEKEYELGFGH